jgi:hypothetical protein
MNNNANATTIDPAELDLSPETDDGGSDMEDLQGPRPDEAPGDVQPLEVARQKRRREEEDNDAGSALDPESGEPGTTGEVPDKIQDAARTLLEYAVREAVQRESPIVTPLFEQLALASEWIHERKTEEAMATLKRRKDAIETRASEEMAEAVALNTNGGMEPKELMENITKIQKECQEKGREAEAECKEHMDNLKRVPAFAWILGMLHCSINQGPTDDPVPIGCPHNHMFDRRAARLLWYHAHRDDVQVRCPLCKEPAGLRRMPPRARSKGWPHNMLTALFAPHTAGKLQNGKRGIQQ